jgi:hypothetical protein
LAAALSPVAFFAAASSASASEIAPILERDAGQATEAIASYFAILGWSYFLEWPAGSSRQDSCQRRHDERTGDCPRQRPELALASWRKRFATLLFSQKAEW